MDFVAIDIETANADLASICQIGLVGYADNQLSQEWKTYIDPEDYFDPINVSVHGIDEMTVSGAPTFPQVYEELSSILRGRVAVCHTHFDRVALNQAANRYDLQSLKCRWLDSARVARRTWKECAWHGYGIANVCRIIGYNFQHHDALEDAKACAQVLLAANRMTDLDIDGWMQRVTQPIDPKASGSGRSIAQDGNPEGELFGEVMVFTGTLEIPRREAAKLAAEIGCQVTSGVTQKTTMLVVGDQDIKRLAGQKKSSKHRKAETLIAKGQPIRILGESAFKQLVQLSNES